MVKMFSNRINDVPKSFIREILKVAGDPSMISFAGGLPNGSLFPIEHLKNATMKVFEKGGPGIMQYSNSEGYLPLREKIAERYRSSHGIEVDPELLLITNGSQQGLDILGKIFINEGDDIIIEEPGYLGAIQAFATYRATFNTVPVNNEGIDLKKLEQTLESTRSKLIYVVPNFQNPSGITYSDENRAAAAEIIKKFSVFLIEDNPYGELRFAGTHKKSFYTFLPEQTILLGTISKTIAPSFRLGWIYAPKAVSNKLLVAKQAADLHTNYISQRIVEEFLSDYSLDEHIEKIRIVYGEQKSTMINAIKKYFPPNVKYTDPEGGMFIWGTLPKGLSSVDLFDRAIEKHVAFVPGDAFYVNRKNVNTFRLNYSNADDETINKGIKILGQCIKEML